jgi:hypothetical protein
LSIDLTPLVLFYKRGFELLAAGRTASVLEKLKLQAPFVFALHHQRLPASLARVLDERARAAVRAGYVQRTAAAGQTASPFGPRAGSRTM